MRKKKSRFMLNTDILTLTSTNLDLPARRTRHDRVNYTTRALVYHVDVVIHRPFVVENVRAHRAW
jgi:hypothetical protein